MRSSNAGATDDSATISDDSGATTETDDANIEVDTGDSTPPIESSPYEEGEKVFAYHSQHLYPAKVQNVEFHMKEWRYYVHYLGWNKSWDEWVGADRLLKFNEANAHQQQELQKKDGSEKFGRSSHIKPQNSTAARGRKRKNNSALKGKDVAPLEKLAYIQIPPTLKKQLVYDCDLVTHLGKLVELPRKPNVDEILNKYLDYRLKKDGMISDSVKEILNGLRCYFDKALPAMLLYKTERQQYQDTITDNVSPSTVYGAEHLLRLFVKLPEILHHANIEAATLTELQQKLVQFLKVDFLKNHCERISGEDPNIDVLAEEAEDLLPCFLSEAGMQ